MPCAFTSARACWSDRSGAPPAVGGGTPLDVDWLLICVKLRASGMPLADLKRFVTLRIHSALEAVGLTAAVSRELADAGLSCNVVAAFHHDHLFVPYEDADRAVAVLGGLARRSA